VRTTAGPRLTRARRRLLVAGVLAVVAFATLSGGAAAEAPRNNGTPTITGIADVGQTVTGHNGSWFCMPGPCAYAFQWQRCSGGCLDIPGAAQQDYVVTPEDGGSTLRVAVTATNYDCNATITECRYVSVTAYSSQVGPVPGLFSPPKATSPPSIAGAAREGESLTATSGVWTGADPISFAYQWSRCDAAGNGCFAIPGAVGPDYVLTEADGTRTVRVVVTATNPSGSRTASSAPSPVVVPAPKVEQLPPALVVQPGITGAASEGETLVASRGTWSGTPTISYAFQWQRCPARAGECADVAGARSESYVVGDADSGSRLRVVVRATNVAGSASASSEQTAIVGPEGLLELPRGLESIPVTSVAYPNTLKLELVAVSPRPLTSRRTVTLRLRVRDLRGYAVREAEVSIRPVRAGALRSVRPRETAADGSVSFVTLPGKRVVYRKGASIAVAVTATAPGEGSTDSIAVRRTFAIPLAKPS
jgi:hypothetical protein